MASTLRFRSTVKFLSVAVLMAATFSACGTSTASNTSSEITENASAAEEKTASGDSSASADAAAFTESEGSVNALNDAEEQAKSSEISLVMVGDMLLHDDIESYALQDDGTYDYSSIFSHTQDLIKEADLAMVNQEVMLGGEELGISGYPNFNGPFAFGDALANAGFDLVLHGTNHALDRGSSGISNCLSFWQENYPAMGVLGIHTENEETRPSATNEEGANLSYSPNNDVLLYEENDLTLAVINATYSTNGIALPYTHAVNMLDEDTVLSDISWAEDNADFTIICPHWGTEYSLEVSSYQDYWAELFLENGVDLVIGTHPHVIEPIKTLTDEKTGHSMLVYYSLGNFVNWTAGSGAGTADRMVGGMACVTIAKDEDGTAFIEEDSVIPLVCHLSNEPGELSVYPFYEYTEELGEENAIRLQDANFSYEYCEDLISQVWGDYENTVTVP